MSSSGQIPNPRSNISPHSLIQGILKGNETRTEPPFSDLFEEAKNTSVPLENLSHTSSNAQEPIKTSFQKEHESDDQHPPKKSSEKFKSDSVSVMKDQLSIPYDINPHYFLSSFLPKLGDHILRFSQTNKPTEISVYVSKLGVENIELGLSIKKIKGVMHVTLDLKEDDKLRNLLFAHRDDLKSYLEQRGHVVEVSVTNGGSQSQSGGGQSQEEKESSQDEDDTVFNVPA
ncbi:MAG: hypothetical protein HRT90_04170 [Candidatus Margulisbacteria bacterium]|nr:hypothetical protein [Candidatus Margulisiibacteriota bacterium]